MKEGKLRCGYNMLSYIVENLYPTLVFFYNSPQPTESARKYYFQNEEMIFIIELLSNITLSHQMGLKAKYNKITIVEEIAEQFVTEEFAMTLALGKPPETK